MKNDIQKHLAKLGCKALDRVTGYKGVITSISFDLYGCVQYLFNPGAGEDGKLGEVFWFDANRIQIISQLPVMEQPEFCKSSKITSRLLGPENKPIL